MWIMCDLGKEVPPCAASVELPACLPHPPPPPPPPPPPLVHRFPAVQIAGTNTPLALLSLAPEQVGACVWGWVGHSWPGAVGPPLPSHLHCCRPPPHPPPPLPFPRRCRAPGSWPWCGAAPRRAWCSASASRTRPRPWRRRSTSPWAGRCCPLLGSSGRCFPPRCWRWWWPAASSARSGGVGGSVGGSVGGGVGVGADASQSTSFFLPAVVHSAAGARRSYLPTHLLHSLALAPVAPRHRRRWSTHCAAPTRCRTCLGTTKSSTPASPLRPCCTLPPCTRWCTARPCRRRRRPDARC